MYKIKERREFGKGKEREKDKFPWSQTKNKGRICRCGQLGVRTEARGTTGFTVELATNVGVGRRKTKD